MLEDIKIRMTGILHIYDKDSGELLLEDFNSIHPENMALAIVQSLGNKADKGPIKKMVFGNGGAYVNGIGNITYLAKNIVGINATLYNQTYEKIIDDNNVNNIDPTRNYITYAHVNGNLFSDLICVATLEYTEPYDQNVIDNADNTGSTYYFNELGLVNYDNKLLTMVVFSPNEKSSNKTLEIRYTIRTQMV